MADEQENRVRTLVDADEQSEIAATVLAWLNTYLTVYDGDEDLPSRVDFEYLGKTSGLCMSTVHTAYKTRQYINGGYQAQYQFQIVFRLIASNMTERLWADEFLNGFGAWCESNAPDPPAGINRWKVRRDTGASIMARYDNNAEDHTIQLTLTYEVI